MTENESYAMMLEEVQIAYEKGATRSELWQKMHSLAEAQYRPALTLFLKLMDDEDWDWRLEGVQLSGHHYVFEVDSPIPDRIRHLLEFDPSNMVRSAATFALGSFSTWPDLSLFKALTNDPDNTIRQNAFHALLLLGGVRPPEAWKELNSAQDNKIIPTKEYLFEVLARYGKHPHVPENATT